jgi:hypothetical protein
MDEGKIDVLNKHLEKKISKFNSLMKPFEYEDDEDGMSFIKQKTDM